MPRLQIRRQEQILERMIGRIVSRTNLTDLSDSAAVKQILAAVARELDEAYFQMTRLTDLFSIDTASGTDLDERARDIQPVSITRLGPRTAIGTVVFSRASNTGATLVIPTGSRVKTSDGTIFATTQQAQITNTSPEQISGHGVGRDSNIVSATAELPGTAGNIAAGAITRFVSKPPGVNEVTNVSAFTNGRDEESDDAFRQRLQDFVATLARSTVQALEFVALGIENPTSGTNNEIVFSHVFEDPINRGEVILYVDDGAGTAATRTAITGENLTQGLAGPPANSAVGGEEFLFTDNFPIDDDQPISVVSSTRGTLTRGVEYWINPPSGRLFFNPALTNAEVITVGYTHYTGLIQEVQRVIDGDKNDRVNYPGWRAGGVSVQVKPPVIVNQNVTAVLTLLEGFSESTVIANAVTAVSNYINGLGISGDVVRNELIEQIMAVPGVFDVSLTFPLTNQTILDNEIARIATADINIT